MRGLLSNRGNGNVGRRILLQVDKHRFDRVDDANVARTSAQVSRELKSNARFISVWKTLHDISRGNEHAGRTVAALQPVMNRERPAQTLHQIIVVEAFDRPNLLMITGHCERDAGAHRFTAYKDRTRATNAVLATEVGASQVLVIAKKIAQMGTRRDVAADCPIVYGEFNDRHGNSC